MENKIYEFAEGHETLSDHSYDQAIMNFGTIFLNFCQNMYMQAKVAKGATMGTPSPVTKSALCLPGRGVAIDNTALVRFKRLV